MNKKLLFLTGTRADYGKMKPLMCAVEENNCFDCYIFVTGMHTLKEFGDTQKEIYKDGFKNIHVYMNQIIEEPMDLILANTINGFSRYVRELMPDMIIIHGDRVEALAGAIVGALNNILVAHIEGGEISGTIDESIRHSVSKLAHIHFVSNAEAKDRLIQMGENPNAVFIIGSPDIDVIMDSSRLDFNLIKKHYDIHYKEYAVLMYHPVTTEVDKLKINARQIVDAVIQSQENYIVIYPNNDTGHNVILDEYKRFIDYERVRLFPSIRFEFFLEILRNSKFIIGNSSAGIHEAPVLGLPSINIGTRQKNRFNYASILNCDDRKEDILSAIHAVNRIKNIQGTNYFGNGKSKKNFLNTILSKKIWEISRQKVFHDLKQESD